MRAKFKDCVHEYLMAFAFKSYCFQIGVFTLHSAWMVRTCGCVLLANKPWKQLEKRSIKVKPYLPKQSGGEI